MNAPETHFDTKTKAVSQEEPPLVTAAKAAKRLDISMATFWRRVSDGTLPKPIKIGGLSRWIRSELDAVIETAKARREP